MTSHRSTSTSEMSSNEFKSVDLQPQQQEKETGSSHSSSSYRSITSNTSRANSIKETGFVDFRSKGAGYGSQRGRSGSTREISDEDWRLIYVNDPVKTNEGFEFAGNSIRTSKYSVLTFLPKNLFEQFHRVAYVYFLIIAILNQLPQLAVFGRYASILPLTLVLLVTAIKDGCVDWRRHRSDRIENNRLSSVLVNNTYDLKAWKDIQVGEIIRFSANETILLYTSWKQVGS